MNNNANQSISSSSTFQHKQFVDKLHFLNRESYGIYNRPLARYLGSLNAAIFLAELVERRHYHAIRGELIDNEKHGFGWIYQTREAIEERTCLSRCEQDTCIKLLKERDLIQVAKFGVPNRRHFRLNDDKILEIYNSQFVGNQQTSLRETSKLDCRKTTNQVVEIPQTAPYIEEPKEEPKKEVLAQSAQTAAPLRAKPKLEIIVFDPDKKEFSGITEKDLADWQEAYPGIDIKRELALMKQWILSNPSKAKKTLWRKFITNWLNSACEKHTNKLAYQSAKGSGHGKNVKDSIRERQLEEYKQHNGDFETNVLKF